MFFSTALHFLSLFFLFLGGGFVFLGALGLVRFANFWSRLHASGLLETLGAQSILLGLMLNAGFSYALLKLLAISLILLITSPATTHTIANGAYHDGLLKTQRNQMIKEDIK